MRMRPRRWPELTKSLARVSNLKRNHDFRLSRQRHIARNVLLVSGAFVLAAAAGLIRNAIIARQFGIGADLDAYYAAFKLPDLLFTVVAGGALATAFIPVFAGFLAADNREGAWRLASAITNWVVLVAGLLALVVAIAAPWLVRTVIAPGFDPAQAAETAAVMRIVLVSTLIFCVSALQGSILHGFKHFLLPALAPVVYPLGVIVGAVWLAPLGRARAGCRRGDRRQPAPGDQDPRPDPLRVSLVADLARGHGAVRKVAVLLGPRVLDLGVFHLTLLATTNLASRLGSGSVSAWSGAGTPCSCRRRSSAPRSGWSRSRPWPTWPHAGIERAAEHAE